MDADEPVPQLDYRFTSRRPAWADLPRAVRDGLASAAGSAVVGVEPPVASGFSGGFAAVLHLADGRDVFAKAGYGANPHLLDAYAKEAWVLERLPAAVPAPRLIGAAALGPGEAGEFGWSLLAIEAAGGSIPVPWTTRALGIAHEACLACVEALSPAPADLAARLGRMVDTFARAEKIVGALPGLAAGTLERSAGQPRWLDRRLDDVQALVLRARTALAGDTATHNDLRADNLLIDGDRAVVVDWNWPNLGPAWTDWVGLLPIARADGVDVDAALAASPLTRHVDPDDVDAWLAVVAAYMLSVAPQPLWVGGHPAIRQHQRRYARLFLDWLAARRGWT